MTDRMKAAIAELTRLRDQVPKKGLDEKQTAEYLGMWQGLEDARLTLIQKFDQPEPDYPALFPRLTLKKAVQTFAKWIGDMPMDIGEKELRAGLMPMLTIATEALKLDDPTYDFRRRAARRLRDELPALAREWVRTPKLVRDDYGDDEQKYVASVASGIVMTTPVDEG